MLLPLDRTHRFTRLCRQPQQLTVAVDVEAMDSDVVEVAMEEGGRPSDLVISGEVQQ